MKKPSLPSSTNAPSSPVDRPDITKQEYNALPRVDRIYNALMYPRHFQMNNTDEVYLGMMKSAYNIILTAATEQKARMLIKVIITARSLDTAETLELIRATKEFFGKIEIRDVTFDRMVARHKMMDIAERARIAGDLKQERLAWGKLIDLDALEVRETESQAPVIPELPDIVILGVDDDVDDDDDVDVDDNAIIESQPGHSDEEE